jgi:acetoin utilization protein AcuC
MFPFTGLPAEAGGPGAEGSAVNVALPAGTGDASWLRAFHAIIPPLLAQFRPQILVSQHGADTHRLDPLARLQVSIDAQRAAHAAIHALAHDHAGGRWLLTGGGGMSWSTSSPAAGLTCSPRPQASRSTRARQHPPRGVTMSGGEPA